MEYIPSLIIKPESTFSSLAACVFWLNSQAGHTETIDSILNQPNITLINQTAESIKIQTVREVKEQLSYSAYQTGKARYFFFLDAHLLTIPAQNALLKSIEEPPLNTQLIFITQTPEKLLGTIRSRCQIIQLTDPTQSTKNTQKNTAEIHRVFSEIIQSNPGQKITLAGIYKERAEALALCTNILRFLHSQLQDSQTKVSTKKITHNLQILLKTMNYLEHNTNVSLTLENCFFELV